MTFKCPYCESEEYECYDRTGEDTMEPMNLCVREEYCKFFSFIFKVFENIKKDGE